MTKIFAVLLGVGILIFAILLIFLFVSLFAGRKEETAGNKRTPDSAKPLCPRCKTGKKTVGLDFQSEECPYLSSWKNGKCQHFVPMRKPHEK